MSSDYAAIIESKIDNLKKEMSEAEETRLQSERQIAKCNEVISQHAATIAAFEDVLSRGDGSPEPRKVRPEVLNGKVKPKATEAIFATIDGKGGATRDELLALADVIDSDSEDKKHIVQTTIYQLKNKSRIVEKGGKFHRP